MSRRPKQADRLKKNISCLINREFLRKKEYLLQLNKLIYIEILIFRNLLENIL